MKYLMNMKSTWIYWCIDHYIQKLFSEVKLFLKVRAIYIYLKQNFKKLLCVSEY